MENKVKYTFANGNICLGSLRNKTDVMITMVVPDSLLGNFHDYHLTTQQAKDLLSQLKTVLKNNKPQDDTSKHNNSGGSIKPTRRKSGRI